MTDEEKAKEWVRTNSGYSTIEFHGKKAIEAFLAGLKTGRDMAETGLKELKEENCELLGIIQGKDKVIQELEKENAELKDKLEILIAVGNTCTKGLNKQLTKAKELLARFIMGSVYFNGKETDLVEEAEQFISEVGE